MTEIREPHHVDDASAELPKPNDALVSMVNRLFERWHLDAEQQAALLGLSPQNAAALVGHGTDHEIEVTSALVERIGHLLAIHAQLRLLFPKNRDLAYRWISTSNNAFDGRTPVAVVREHGISGLLMLRSYLGAREA